MGVATVVEADTSAEAEAEEDEGITAMIAGVESLRDASSSTAFRSTVMVPDGFFALPLRADLDSDASASEPLRAVSGVVGRSK
jgi:hypothetical protein